MQIRSGGWVLALLMWVPMAAGAHGTTTRSHILRLEHTWLKASRERDLVVLERVLGKDYVDINYKGVLRNRANMLAAPNVRMRGYVQRLREERVRLFGDAAIVNGLGLLEDKASHRVLASWRYTDVFVRQRGTWRAVSSQETMLWTARPEHGRHRP